MPLHTSEGAYDLSEFLIQVPVWYHALDQVALPRKHQSSAGCTATVLGCVLPMPSSSEVSRCLARAATQAARSSSCFSVVAEAGQSESEFRIISRRERMSSETGKLFGAE